MIQAAERLFRLYDSSCALWPKGALRPFKPKAVNMTATQASKGIAAYLVDMAKAQTLDAMGEQSVAIELVKRHVGP